MQQGQYDLALDELSRAEHYTAPSPLTAAEISFLRGQCYDRSSRASEARGAYLYTMQKFPGTIYARQAQERLTAMKELTEQGAAPNAASPQR
jgi:hypothetical protein